MFVKEWMTKEPKAVTPKTAVLEAMQILKQEGFRRLPVVDQGNLVGFVTDRDLKEASPSKATTLSIYELNYLLAKLTVGEIMQTEVISVAPNDPIEKAAILMDEHKISGLTVVSDSKLIGIVTISDILKAFVGVLGLKEGGIRVTVQVPDEPGVLETIAKAGAPSNIVTVVTSGIKEGQKRELVLRASGQKMADFPERLRAKGVEITDIQE